MKNLSLDIELFGKWKDRVALYNNNPLNPTYDASKKASLGACGGNLQLDFKPIDILALHWSMGISRSKVFEGDAAYYYDWDSPFFNKAAVSLSFFSHRLTLYCIGTMAAGFPYRELMATMDSTLYWSQTQGRLPWYTNVDFKAEWKNPVDGKFVTEYSGFVQLQNALGMNNVREYQWGENGRYDVPLQPFTVNFGLRLNFRFLYL
jgi:hypothetical protein